MENKKKQILTIVVLLVILAGFLAGLAYWQSNQRGEFTIGEGDDQVTFMELKKKDLDADKYEIYKNAVTILKETPHDKAQTLNLGYRYREAGYYNEAEKAFNQHLKVDPYDPEALLGLSRIKVNKYEYQEAEKHYYEILEVFPLYEKAYEELLVLYQDKKLPKNQLYIDSAQRGLEFDEEGEYQELLKKFLLDYNSIRE